MSTVMNIQPLIHAISRTAGIKECAHMKVRTCSSDAKGGHGHDLLPTKDDLASANHLLYHFYTQHHMCVSLNQAALAKSKREAQRTRNRFRNSYTCSGTFRVA